MSGEEGLCVVRVFFLVPSHSFPHPDRFAKSNVQREGKCMPLCFCVLLLSSFPSLSLSLCPFSILLTLMLSVSPTGWATVALERHEQEEEEHANEEEVEKEEMDSKEEVEEANEEHTSWVAKQSVVQLTKTQAVDVGSEDDFDDD